MPAGARIVRRRSRGLSEAGGERGVLLWVAEEKRGHGLHGVRKLKALVESRRPNRRGLWPAILKFSDKMPDRYAHEWKDLKNGIDVLKELAQK